MWAHAPPLSFPHAMAYTPFRIVVMIECVLSCSMSCPVIGYFEKVLLKVGTLYQFKTTVLVVRY